MTSIFTDTTLFIAGLDDLIPLAVFVIVVIVRIFSAFKKKDGADTGSPQETDTIPQHDKDAVRQLIDQINRSLDDVTPQESRRSQHVPDLPQFGGPDYTGQPAAKVYHAQRNKKRVQAHVQNEPIPEPARVKSSPVKIPVPPHSPPPRCASESGALQGLGTGDMKKAVVLSEVLGQPLALRDDKPVWMR